MLEILLFVSGFPATQLSFNITHSLVSLWDGCSRDRFTLQRDSMPVL